MQYMLYKNFDVSLCHVKVTRLSANLVPRVPSKLGLGLLKIGWYIDGGT